MNDLSRAKEILSGGGYTLVLVKGGETITSSSRGVAPLIELIDGGRSLEGFSAADLIVGRAAALLYAHLRVSFVYAKTLSLSAEEVLREHGIYFECGSKTETIINRKGDGPCPMEQAVKGVKSPYEAVIAIKNKIKEMTSK